jgi:hypothetical protein
MYTTVYVYDFPSRSSKLSSRSLRLGNKELLHTTGPGTQFQTALPQCIRHLESGEKWALSPLAYVLFSPLCGFEGNEISVACACMRIGRARPMLPSTCSSNHSALP